MENKQIIDGVDVSECDFLVKEDDYCSYSGEYRGYKGQCGCSDEEMCKDHPNCFYKKYLKRLARKEQEYEDLRQYHNKCCEEFKKEKQDLIDKYNQLSINFYNGDYCNTEHCSLLKSKEKECERLEQTLIQIKEIVDKELENRSK